MARILIVDDNLINRRLVTSLLGFEGHDVIEASDGIQALAKARVARPELIISDVLMPLMDGFDFVRRLRSDPDLAAIPVIFNTAHYLEPEARELARSCKVTRILAKPCESASMLEAVAEALAGPVAEAAPEAGAGFDSAHLRLLTNKLADKVRELQAEIDERKRAQERVQHLNRVYALLSGINSLIVRVANREELCQEACRLAVQEGRFQLAWIGLRDPQSRQLVPVAWAGPDPGLQQFTQVSASGNAERSDMVSRALIELAPIVCNDLRAGGQIVLQRDRLLQAGYRGMVVLPLVMGMNCVGCMVLVTEIPEFFVDAEMRLLTELAGDVAFALDHIEKVERLDYLAYYDSLTGLANRKLFLDRLAQQMEISGRRSSGVAVVVLDIERLDVVNDSFGRHAGDQLLRLAAERLVQCVGSQKDVGRAGSHHLCVMLDGVAHDGDAMQAMERWHRDWSAQPFLVDGHEISLAAKCGIACFPGDGPDAETLLRNAEAALKQAKRSAERHAFYTRNLSEARSHWLALESKLRRALQNDEFSLHYQPKVELETRRLKGVEALLRWHNRDLGSISPVKFIPVLEQTGLIFEVGTWVMRQACLDRSLWRERGLPAPRIAVNVSPAQLAREDFVRTTANVLKLAGPDAGIDIEVTESLLMSDVDLNTEKLRALRALGIGIAIDDFGTGYSSLGYLSKLPVETLKVDRSFVTAMLDDPSTMTLVSTIISLAHSLKLSVVAEGVELEEQAKILRLLRCEQMQGYLVSKPLSFDDMTAWLARNR